jgi:hypothetical protein
MGDSAPRKQPPDAKGTGETWEAASAEPEQESQAPPSDDPTKKQGPQSKFHGNEDRR